MDNQEKISKVIKAIKMLGDDMFNITNILTRLEKRIEELESKPMDRREFLGLDKSQTEKEVKPAMYRRVTANLQELMCLFNQEDEWEVNFIQGILDFSGQTVTDKQYKVLEQLAEKVNYEEELVIKR